MPASATCFGSGAGVHLMDEVQADFYRLHFLLAFRTKKGVEFRTGSSASPAMLSAPTLKRFARTDLVATSNATAAVLVRARYFSVMPRMK